MAERATIPKFIIGLGGLPSPEYDDDTWFYHVKTGEIFNQAVTNARMTAYFRNAIGTFIQPSTINPYIGGGCDFDYVVPGQLPENDADKATYDFLFRKIKSRDQTIRRLRRIFEGFASSSEGSVVGEESIEGKLDHVKGRRRPVSIAAE